MLSFVWTGQLRKEKNKQNQIIHTPQAVKQYSDCMQTLHAQKLDCYVAGSKNIARSQWVAHKGTTILSHTPNVSFSPRNCMLFIQLLIKFIPQVPQIPQWDFCIVLDHTVSFFFFFYFRKTLIFYARFFFYSLFIFVTIFIG